jgi:hypothetical protein
MYKVTVKPRNNHLLIINRKLICHTQPQKFKNGRQQYLWSVGGEVETWNGTYLHGSRTLERDLLLEEQDLVRDLIPQEQDLERVLLPREQDLEWDLLPEEQDPWNGISSQWNRTWSGTSSQRNRTWNETPPPPTRAMTVLITT